MPALIEAASQRLRLLLEIRFLPPPPPPQPERMHPILPGASRQQFLLCRPANRLWRLAKSPQEGAAHALAIGKAGCIFSVLALLKRPADDDLDR